MYFASEEKQKEKILQIEQKKVAMTMFWTLAPIEDCSRRSEV